MAGEVDVVRGWHEALNAGDSDGVAKLTDNAVEVGGPRGTGLGAALVRDWAERAGIRLDPGRVFHRGDAVVVEQLARWRDPDTGAWGTPLALASAFRVVGGRVSRIARFEEVAAALAVAGLDPGDEVTEDGR